MLPVEKLEKVVEEELLLRLESLQGQQETQIVRDTPEINSLKIKLSETETKIQNLIEQLAESTQVTAGYINSHIEKLDAQKRELLDNIAQLEMKANKIAQMNVDIDDVLLQWQNYDLETKKRIAKEVIEKIVLEGEEASIIFY